MYRLRKKPAALRGDTVSQPHFTRALNKDPASEAARDVWSFLEEAPDLSVESWLKFQQLCETLVETNSYSG